MTAAALSTVLRMSGISKTYGVTKALSEVELSVGPGEIVGLIGHNGAGKSTLMRVITGITEPDAGTVDLSGDVRIAYQELSLAPDLRVFENAALVAPGLRGVDWRRRSRAEVTRQLDEIFPGHGIAVSATTQDLSLAQQQMLEIAQATLDAAGGFVLLILDEPTSSLGPEQADNLFKHLRVLQERGVSTILITHKLAETLAHTDRVVVMRDGRIVAERPTDDLDHDGVVALMGGATAGADGDDAVADVAAPGGIGAARDGGTALVARVERDEVLRPLSLTVAVGEIVGLAGLEGQGQQQLLEHLWQHRSGRSGVRSTGAVRFAGGVCFVTGDRRTAGLFPLWDLARNIGIGVLGRTSRWGVVSREQERRVTEEWVRRLSVRGAADSPVTALSGGNQQKALIARALASPARTVLLDDPFRGVDVETKQQIYRLMRDEARTGRSFLWFTTENAELSECDRVYVMSGFGISAELDGEHITDEAVIAASFDRSES